MQSADPHKSLGSALGRIPSGVFILTLSNGSIETGMLASWAQQCSFKPPMISFAVQRNRPIVSLLSAGAAFTLNILEAAQTDVIAHFGKGFALTDNAFVGQEVDPMPPHGPVLKEAHAYLHGIVQTQIAAGDHEIFLAEITAGALLEEGQPMVHIRKNGFHY